MAEESGGKKGLSQDTKDTIFKAVVFFVGFKLVKKTITSLFGEEGRIDKVKYNYSRTQYKYLNLGGSPPKFKAIPDPWTPEIIANELYEVMHGIAGEPGGTPAGYASDLPREAAWREVLQLGKDRVRWLHNYWLEKIDPKETLYRWVKGEVPAPFSSEDYTKQELLRRLMDFGVGF